MSRLEEFNRVVGVIWIVVFTATAFYKAPLFENPWVNWMFWLPVVGVVRAYWRGYR